VEVTSPEALVFLDEGDDEAQVGLNHAFSSAGGLTADGGRHRAISGGPVSPAPVCLHEA
jgi:hypothetical protein